MLTSCSDYHIFDKLKFKSRQECIDSYCEVVDAAFEAGVRPRCHLEDVTRADIEGFVLPFVERLMRDERAGAGGPEGQDPPVRHDGLRPAAIPGAELPRSIPKLIYKLNHECGVPSEPAGVARPQRLPQGPHQRRDRLALRLQRAEHHAVRHSGERTGNPPLEGAIIEYIALQGRPVRHRHRR